MTLEEEIQNVKDNYNPEYRTHRHGYGKYNSRGVLVVRNKKKDGYKPIYDYFPPYNPETQYSKIIGYVEMDNCIIYASITLDYEISEPIDEPTDNGEN